MKTGVSGDLSKAQVAIYLSIDDWTTGDLVGWYGSGSKMAPVLTAITVLEGDTVVKDLTVETF